MLEISEREQRRIGQDLHDGLGQHLTGIAFMSKVLEQKLAERGVAEAADAEKIVRLVNEAINKTRELARGLLPVVSDAEGSTSALRADCGGGRGSVHDLLPLSMCRCRCRFTDVSVATHLYHIAQEAVNNAHQARRSRRSIVISLTSASGIGVARRSRTTGSGSAIAPANRRRYGSAHHAVSGQHDRRHLSTSASGDAAGPSCHASFRSAR